MYTDRTRAAGHHRFLQHSGPCQCPRCVRYDPPPFPPLHGGPVYRPTPTQADHPSLDRRRDIQAPRLKDVGGRAFAVDRDERGGHRSPQRRPVFSVGPGPYSQPDDPSQSYPWDLNPAQWNCPPEPGARHYPAVREHCSCVAVWGDARARPFNTGQPPRPPLPPPHVKGQVHRHRGAVKYVSEEAETNAIERYHLEPYTHGPQAGLLHMPNGHCGQRPVCYEGVEERDSHQDRSRLKGGSEEGCNGRGGPHQGFFYTEVPQKHLNPSRRKGPCAPPPGASSSHQPSTISHHQRQGSDAAEQTSAGQDSVRDQIRQVVTDLEGVLGGLKQVHVEMKEVVQQIDRLTANIDLGEGGGPSTFHGASHAGDLSVALVPNHKPGPFQVPAHLDQDCVILRTSSPSPVHTASVVKTSRVAPAGHGKDINHGVNGHPPHLYALRDANHVPEPPPPRTLDPKVIIENSTSSSRTQKPPPYPQNGRCGKGPYPPPNPARTPAAAYPGRGGRQSSSMV